MAEELSMDDFLDDESIDLFEEMSTEKEDTTEKDTLEAEKAKKEIKEDSTEDKTIAPSDKTKTDDNQNKNLSLFASALAEEGVINLPDGTEVNTFEELTKAIEEQIKSNEFSGLSEKQKDYLEALEKGVTHEEYTQVNSKITDVESITDDSLKENEDLQKKILTEDFIARGYSEDKAKKLVERSVDLNTLYEDSLDGLKSKKEQVAKEKELLIKQREKDVEAQKKQIADIQEKIKKTVYDEKSEVIPGLKFNKKVADEVYESLTKPAGYDENNNPLTRAQKVRGEDPIKFEHTLNTLLVLTKNFTDFTALNTKNTSKKAKEFVDRLTQTSSAQASGFTNLNTGDGGEDLDWLSENLADL